MINIGLLLDACGISYTENQLLKLENLLNSIVEQYTANEITSNQTSKFQELGINQPKDNLIEKPSLDRAVI